MTREEYDRLSIDEKVKYINSKMIELGSVEKVCKSVGISVDAFRSSIKNLYTYIPHFRSYVKISDLEGGLALINEEDENELMVIDAQRPTSSITLTTGLTEIDNAQDKLVSLLSNYDKILELIENAQKHSQSFHSNNSAFMDLNMPNNNQLKKTTIRVNEQIWEEFKKCIDTEFNHLEQYDMISVALRDFINKYSLQNKKDV